MHSCVLRSSCARSSRAVGKVSGRRNEYKVFHLESSLALVRETIRSVLVAAEHSRARCCRGAAALPALGPAPVAAPLLGTDGSKRVLARGA